MYSSLKNLFRLNRIIYSFLVIIISLSSLLSAGAPDTLWTKEYGNGPGEACGYSVQETSDNGFIIAGSFEPTVGGPDYTHDVYIIRTDSLGDTLWTKKYGGAEDFEEGYSVLQTDDGGFIVAGHTGSENDPDQVYLIRTDSNGDSLWTKKYGGSANDLGFSMCKTNDGKFIITGKTESFGAGGMDIYLLKVDSDGDSLWAKTYGGLEDDEAGSVRMTSDGGFIIAGTTESFGIVLSDIYLIRTNSNGDTVWTRMYGDTEDNEGRTAFQTGDGGFVIVGSAFSNSGWDHDVYLIRTDSNGDTLWAKKFGGLGDDEARDAQLAEDGGYIIAGSIEGHEDVYVIRTDPNGDTLWTKRCGGNNEECAYAIQQTTDGGYIIAGSTGPNGNKSNVYLIRLAKEATGIQEETPSPFIKPDVYIASHNYGNNHISIRYDIPYTGSVKLEVFDVKGKLLKKLVDTVMPKGSYTVTWDARQDDNKPIAGGVYFLKLRANCSEVSRKVTIIY